MKNPMTRRLSAALIILLMSLTSLVCHGQSRINVTAISGGGAAYLTDVWALGGNACVLLGAADEGSGYQIILFDTESLSIISTTSIPSAGYFIRQGREEGGLSLLFQGENEALIKALITAEHQVILSETTGDLTLLPGGRAAIQTAVDGSLYAVDLMTNREEKLLQGIPAGGGYDLYQQYVPWPDDAGYDLEYEDGFPLTHPVDEAIYYDNEIWLLRYFSVYEPLDECRFVYAVSGWEWGAGFGIYDLREHTDHRITGQGYLFGRAEDKLFGSHLTANLNTYETSPLPQQIQDDLAQVSAMEDGIVVCDFSADGQLFAVAGLNSRQADLEPIVVRSLETGEKLSGLDLGSPDAQVVSVSFDGNQSLIVLYTLAGSEDFYIAMVGV